LRPTLSMLEQYIAIHFRVEEEIMAEAGYPKLKEHIRQHKKLIMLTENLLQDVLSHPEPETVLKFLKDWWLGHINGEDKKYVPYTTKMLESGNG